MSCWSPMIIGQGDARRRHRCRRRTGRTGKPATCQDEGQGNHLKGVETTRSAKRSPSKTLPRSDR